MVFYLLCVLPFVGYQNSNYYKELASSLLNTWQLNSDLSSSSVFKVAIINLESS